MIITPAEETATQATAPVRLATEADIPGIQALIRANEDKLLPRSDQDIRELLPTWWVIEEDCLIVGTCCLEIYSPKIAELRSLAVRAGVRGKGYGTALVGAAIAEAQRHNIRQVLVVTSTPEFFRAHNFGACLDEKYALFWDGH
jgi:N-acetylglutamate synthase-like GNAT family acetyltransferase